MKVDKCDVYSSAIALGTSRLDVMLQEALQLVKGEHCIGSPIGRSRISAACRSGLTFSSRLVVLLVMLGLGQSGVLAQIVPDGTLGSELSSLSSGPLVNVTNPASPVTLIQGGALRGANLFHSFSNFNVAQGQKVYFTNPVGVTTILTRITGTQASLVDGTLGIDGSARLFIMNPNGITFGKLSEFSRLTEATTAEEARFGSGLVFSAVDPKPVPEISLNVPLGLQWGMPITNIEWEALKGDILVVGGHNHGISLSAGSIDTSQASIGAHFSPIFLKAKKNIKTGEIYSISADVTMISGGEVDTTSGAIGYLTNDGIFYRIQRRLISLSREHLIFVMSINA
jgi:filamentous hemagglutinin family protein